MYRKFRHRIHAPALKLAVLALLFLAASAPSTSFADEIVGSVTKSNGIVELTRAGATIEATPGTPVRLHDTVTTQPDANAMLGFPDGSSLELSESTRVVIEASQVVGGQAMPSRVTLLGGSVHANVPDKSAAGPHTIEVDTPHSRAVGH